MKKISDPSAKKALEKMKLEIANEFDANITRGEAIDGTMVENLVHRAEKKKEKVSKLENKLRKR